MIWAIFAFVRFVAFKFAKMFFFGSGIGIFAIFASFYGRCGFFFGFFGTFFNVSIIFGFGIKCALAIFANS